MQSPRRLISPIIPAECSSVDKNRASLITQFTPGLPAFAPRRSPGIQKKRGEIAAVTRLTSIFARSGSSFFRNPKETGTRATRHRGNYGNHAWERMVGQAEETRRREEKERVGGQEKESIKGA